ncbi:C40 family peptidase [Clostridium sp. CCUG 7971]|uniref:C40 family peptidase n=1 Tax=Clostridium sp. CCUG 7971 TaxID=2811414 RepID=UPI001ABAB96A|nr:C40 family peptidase [Clostridium sp. CCUG 7971]MBO3444603.1 SH3 domain-containing protein [Clostridium sp. CCUG 7971]
MISKNIKISAGLAIVGTAISIPYTYANNQEGIVNTSVLNIRTGPSTDYNVIYKAKKSEKVSIIENNNGWYKVKLSNGKLGWASSNYIKISQTNSNSNDTVQNNSVSLSGQKGKVNVSSKLNLRKEASTNSSIITKLSNGQVVDLLEKSNGWYKVKLSNGQVGWASSDYINLYKVESNNKPAESDNESKPQLNKVQAIVKKAHEQLGKSYVWGAEGPNSFDCSGLVHYVYGQHGIKTPRVSRDQYKAGKSVSQSNLQPGDLIFSSTDGSGRVTHVGIYVGEGKMIHAPNSKGVVKKVDINASYWQKAYVGAKRII